MHGKPGSEGGALTLAEPECFFPFLDAQRQDGYGLKGSPRLTVFAVIPGAAHSVPHAAFPALSASKTDLHAYTRSSAAGAGAVLLSATLLILCARVGLWEGSGVVVSNSDILVPTPSRSPATSSKALPNALLPRDNTHPQSHTPRILHTLFSETPSGSQHPWIPDTPLTW